MRFEVSRRTASDDDRILPLINVVFLLLIFFMLAGRLAASDPLNVAPPRSASEGAAKTGETVISVAADGRVALDGAIVESAALAGLLRGKAADGPLQVNLRADGQADSVAVVAVMEHIREAGIARLNLLTVPEDR